MKWADAPLGTETLTRKQWRILALLLFKERHGSRARVRSGRNVEDGLSFTITGERLRSLERKGLIICDRNLRGSFQHRTIATITATGRERASQVLKNAGIKAPE